MSNTHYTPGTKLWFTHIHTNEVIDVEEIGKAEQGKVLLILSVKAKSRPMLLLWGKDDIYTVLYMTSADKRFFGKRVKICAGSFVDCSRYYEYNERLIDPEREPFGNIRDKYSEEWKQVLDQLPGDMRLSLTEDEDVYRAK